MTRQDNAPKKSQRPPLVFSEYLQTMVRPSTRKIAEQFAAADGISRAEVVRRWIALGAYMEGVTLDGYEDLIRERFHLDGSGAAAEGVTLPE